MDEWSFLTNHGKALLLIAHDPDVRLSDIADSLAISERRSFGIVDDLTRAGYLVKERVGRRNRYQVQGHLPVPDGPPRMRAIGEVLELLMGDGLSPGGQPPPSSRSVDGSGTPPK